MTNQTLKNPKVITPPNPQGIDVALQQVNNRIATLSWLEKCFGRAWTRPKQVTDKDKRVEPMVYMEGAEYYPALPNDALQSYSFWQVPGPRNTEGYKANVAYNTFFFTDPASMIFWVDLKKIDPTKDYIFTEELIRDVLRLLNRDANVAVVRVWDDRVEDIFKGYTLFPEHRDLLMYPYAAFRIEITLRYEFSC